MGSDSLARRVLGYCDVRTGVIPEVAEWRESRQCWWSADLLLVSSEEGGGERAGVQAEIWSKDLPLETREMREELVRRRGPGKSAVLSVSPVRWCLEHAHNRPIQLGSLVDRDSRAGKRV